jgi:hypothetical protein
LFRSAPTSYPSSRARSSSYCSVLRPAAVLLVIFRSPVYIFWPPVYIFRSPVYIFRSPIYIVRFPLLVFRIDHLVFHFSKQVHRRRYFGSIIWYFVFANRRTDGGILDRSFGISVFSLRLDISVLLYVFQFFSSI